MNGFQIFSVSLSVLIVQVWLAIYKLNINLWIYIKLFQTLFVFMLGFIAVFLPNLAEVFILDSWLSVCHKQNSWTIFNTNRAIKTSCYFMYLLMLLQTSCFLLLNSMQNRLAKRRCHVNAANGLNRRPS